MRRWTITLLNLMLLQTSRAVAQELPSPPPARLEVDDKTLPPNLDMRQLCLSLMDSVVQGIRTLKSSAMTAKVPIKASDNTELLGTWTKQSCESKVDRKRILAQAAKFLTQHSRRAGLIIRLTDASGDVNKEILNGYRAAFVDLGLKPDQSIVVVDPTNQPSIQAAVAKLVLEKEVTVLSGGLERGDADQLSRWSNVLRMPALIMSRDKQLTDGSQQAFRVYPSPDHLAGAIADFAQLGMAKKIAVLRPNTPEGQVQADTMRAALATRGISAEPEVTFEQDNFDSIENAAKKLFKVAVGDRRGEFQKVLAEAKQKAKKMNYQFSAKMVTLPPLIDFDGVFVPVDFRTIRHVAKVFQFLGVKDLRMYGNFQWRSRSLVEPPDPFLERSLFADFVGRYEELPKSIRPSSSNASMFLPQKDARLLDYRMLGYYTGRIAAMSLLIKDVKRNILFRSIARLSQTVEPQYFGTGAIFDKDRLAKWPAQMLKIVDKNIAVAGPQDALLPSPSPTAQNLPVLSK